MTLVVKSSRFDVSADELFAFHMDSRTSHGSHRPGHHFVLVSSSKPTELNDVQVFQVGPWPFTQTWQARITRVVPGRLLEDTQESGPFLRWRHQHRMATDGPGSRLTDIVGFRLLPTPAGAFLEYWLIRPAILCMFAWRHRRTRQLLSRHIPE